MCTAPTESRRTLLENSPPAALLIPAVSFSRICLLLIAVASAAAQPGVRAQFVGGTLTGLHAKSTFRLNLADTETLVLQSSSTSLRIPYGRINTLEYGQNVSRRYAAAILISPVLLLSKSRKHFVTLGYVDPNDKQQAVVIRVEKGDIRSVLSSLEARTGRRIEYTDDEARKSGK